MAKVSRKTIRQALVTGLTTALAASVNAARVVGYQPTMQGDFPWVAVLSDGSQRPELTFQGTSVKFFLNINIFVVRKASGLTEEQAESLLDDLEALVAQYIETNRGNSTNWNALEYSDRSRVSWFIPQGGETYLMESIPIIVTVLL